MRPIKNITNKKYLQYKTQLSIFNGMEVVRICEYFNKSVVDVGIKKEQGIPYYNTMFKDLPNK